MPQQVRTVQANGITLAWEDFGDPSDPTVLMVMGLGTQMIGWPDELCEALAGAGLHVVRFDNRDVGLSTHLDGAPAPGLGELVLHPRRAPYRIEDLADDAAGLLDALGAGAAHVVGASMGGFIAQALAIRRPELVRSLTLIMTSTGSRLVGKPSVAATVKLLAMRPQPGLDAAVDQVIATFRVIGSPGYDFDETFLRDLARRSAERSVDPAGYRRQLAACTVQTDRTRALRRLAVPAVVIHGLADPLVNPSGGLAVARAIPGAAFVGISGMGHDLPRGVWRRVTGEVLGVAGRAGSGPRRPPAT